MPKQRVGSPVEAALFAAGTKLNNLLNGSRYAKNSEI
jgi:hypothetical protein